MADNREQEAIDILARRSTVHVIKTVQVQADPTQPLMARYAQRIKDRMVEEAEKIEVSAEEYAAAVEYLSALAEREGE